MTFKYIQDKTFEKINFNEVSPEPAEYENCIFFNCDFSYVDLSGINFAECKFKQCNLSLAKLNKTTFRDVLFTDCNMLGLRLDDCNQVNLCFGFENCKLDHSSFFKTKIKKTMFKNCQLLEADFTESDLTSSAFDNCDLDRAIFDNSILEKADFRTACNYSIDPEANRVKKARFSFPGVLGLLSKYNIEIESY